MVQFRKDSTKGDFPMLQLCVSQQQNDIPFAFKSTGIRVYSFEEAIYHVFHYWRESVDDFLSDPMIAWVSELGLSYIASKMKDLAHTDNFTARLLSFLQLVDYFSREEIAGLTSTLQAWEQRREWEKLKERADHLVERGEPARALSLYKRALGFEENVALLNNMGVVCMQLSASKEAAGYLARAMEIEPQNLNILLHYIEAAILSRQYENAALSLQMAESIAPNNADIQFLHGLFAYEQKNYIKALAFYEKAVQLDPDVPYYIYKMADVHMAIRQFAKALETMQTIPVKDAAYYLKEAEIHAAAADVPASLKCMRRATSAPDGTTNANLWAKLAEYYRRDYDWRRAEKAISYALGLAPDNDLVRLESARIKKGLGRTRDYQAELSEILKSFKDRYRADR